MKTKRTLALIITLATALLTACTSIAQPPAHSFEIQQRNAAGDGWIDRQITPQPGSMLTFGTDRVPGTTLVSTFATASDLSLLNSNVGTLQTQVTTNTGAISSLQSGKENTGVAASLLSAHTAAANPHTQYALAASLSNYATVASLSNYATVSSLSSYATVTTLNTATTALTTLINGKQAASTALSKITESGGLPLWNGSAWPGGSGGGDYTLPAATASTLGGIKVGANLSITSDGTLSATGGGASASGVKVTGATTAGTLTEPTASGPRSIVIGNNSKATHVSGQTIVIGADITNGKENSVQIGYGSSVNDGNETVVGKLAKTQGGEATAYGSEATARGRYSIAVGYQAKTNTSTNRTGAIAIGGQATADADDAVTIGRALTNTDAYTVMIGDATTGKRLKGVADGTQPTDAVNLRQLQSSAGGGGLSINEPAYTNWVPKEDVDNDGATPMGLRVNAVNVLWCMSDDDIGNPSRGWAVGAPMGCSFIVNDIPDGEYAGNRDVYVYDPWEGNIGKVAAGETAFVVAGYGDERAKLTIMSGGNSGGNSGASTAVMIEWYEEDTWSVPSDAHGKTYYINDQNYGELRYIEMGVNWSSFADGTMFSVVYTSEGDAPNQGNVTIDGSDYNFIGKLAGGTFQNLSGTFNLPGGTGFRLDVIVDKRMGRFIISGVQF